MAVTSIRSKFHEYFRAQTNWLVPTLHVITYDTRIVAIMFDTENSRMLKTETQDHLVRVCRLPCQPTVESQPPPRYLVAKCRTVLEKRIQPVPE